MADFPQFFSASPWKPTVIAWQSAKRLAKIKKWLWAWFLLWVGDIEKVQQERKWQVADSTSA